MHRSMPPVASRAGTPPGPAPPAGRLPRGYLASIDPTTGELFDLHRTMSDPEIAEIVRRADAAFRAGRHAPVAARVPWLEALDRRLADSRERLALLMAREMGKPLRQGRAEIDKCRRLVAHCGSAAATVLAPRALTLSSIEARVVYEPLGVLLGVMPWNFPIWQVLRFALPNLLAGNAVLVKHAPSVTGCARALEALLAAAGVSAGLYRVLVIEDERVGDVIAERAVRGVSLTGGVEAGRAVAQRAGAALKKSVLELGGSDPYLLLDDADVPRAAAVAVASRLRNAGQSCIAAKRCIVPRTLVGRFEEAVIERMRAVRVGDPLQEETDVGPLATAAVRSRLERQLEQSVALGARCLTGGAGLEGRGQFFAPTVLTDVGPGMPAYDEELFGPVLAVVPVADEAEAIRVANDSRFGLGAAVFTADVARGVELARRLEAGACAVNASVTSDPALPFGGIKDSGYGRELGWAGFLEFVNLKTITYPAGSPRASADGPPGSVSAEEGER